MNASRARLASCLFTLTVMAVAVAPRAAFAQQKLVTPPEKDAFTRYCAVCHGADGKGDGPLANLMTKKPSNLTLLAKQNNGNFPAQRVARIIDGRDEVAAHGPRDMPVWGQRFGETGRTAGPVSQTAAREQVQLLLQYLSRIQEK